MKYFFDLKINCYSSFFTFQGACLLIGYAYSGPGMLYMII